MICLTSGTFKTKIEESQFSMVTYNGEGVSPLLYSFDNRELKNATIDSYTEITVTDTNIFNPGDELVISIGNKTHSNIVDGKNGETLSLINRLPVKTGNCELLSPYNTVTLDSAFEAGEYYLKPVNEKLVVTESFNNPYVTTADLGTHYPDAYKTDYGIEVLLNEKALLKVYSDLRNIENIYDVVWFDRIKEIKIAAMLMMMFPLDASLKVDYQELVEQTRTAEKVDPDTGEVVAATVTASWEYF